MHVHYKPSANESIRTVAATTAWCELSTMAGNIAIGEASAESLDVEFESKLTDFAILNNNS